MTEPVPAETPTPFPGSHWLRRRGLRPRVFGLPIFFFAVLIVTSLIAPERFLRTATRLNTFLLDIFSKGFTLAAFFFVLICIWAALSPLGRMRIGGAKAERILSPWNWMAITLTTTIATGILFWATAEPIYHLANPGGLDLDPGGREAQRFALSTLYLHWSFTPYAIYTIPGLTFALAYHNFRLPFSLASPFRAVRGKALPEPLRDLIDGLALLSLLFGLAASLGAGILSLSGGLDRVTGIGSTRVVTALITLLVVGGFALSSASGLQRGIRVLSDINTRIFLAFLLVVLIAGPTVSIIQDGGLALMDYVKDFVPRSLLIEPFDDQDWAKAWTVFYFANWLAWAPLSAMFLGRIARGYTVRAYILVNWVGPALFSILWMTVFGGFALQVDRREPGVLQNVLNQAGPEHVLYAVIDRLPLAGALVWVIIILTYLSYVTAADSNTDVLARISSTRQKSSDRRPVLKMIWAGTVGLAAWIMVSLSGIDGIRMLSNLGGLPALFIVTLFALILIWMGTKGLSALSRPRNPDGPISDA